MFITSMGLFGTLFEKADSAIDWTFEAPKRIIGIPGNVINWARNRVSETMLESKKVENAGATVDLWMSAVSDAVSRFLGAGKVEQTEKRVFLETREKIRKAADTATSVSRRINLPAGEEAVRHEKRTTKVFSEELERESSVDMPEIKPVERTVLSYLTNRINHYRTEPLKLLSSTHPLTKIAQRRARYLNISPSIKDLSDVQLLRYPLLEQGNDISREDGENAYREQVSGNVRKTVLRGHPRISLTGEQRRRVVDGPKIQDGRYEVLLEEPDENFQNRCLEQQQKRSELVAEPFHLTLKMGEEGFPVDGNPYYIYRTLSYKYPKIFNNVDRDQIAMGIHSSGNQISIAGFVTKDRPETPEPLSVRRPPQRFDDDYYDGFISGKHTDRIQWLLREPSFNKKYNVYNFSRINAAVEQLQRKNLNIGFGDMSVHPFDPIAKRQLGNNVDLEHTNTLHFDLKINGESNNVTMFNGNGILQLDEKSAIYKAKEDNGEVQTPYVTIDEFLDILENLSNGEILNKPSHYSSNP